MSETVKLIIEIPKKIINEIKDNAMFSGSISSDIRWEVTSAIVNSTPLDDVKAEIEKCKEVANVPYDKDYLTTVWAYDDAIRVLDNIGKGDSEC